MSTSDQDPRATVIGESVQYLDGDGERWRVTERDCRGVPGARGSRCLVFMSEFVSRRIWTYPAGWRTLPVAALIALSWQR
jgi:hypothetical protein